MGFGLNIMIARMTCLMTCQISVVHLLQVPQKNAIPRLFRMSILEIRIDAFPLPVTSTQDKIPSLDSKVMCMWLWMRFQSHSCITENLNCLKYTNWRILPAILKTVSASASCHLRVSRSFLVTMKPFWTPGNSCLRRTLLTNCAEGTQRTHKGRQSWSQAFNFWICCQGDEPCFSLWSKLAGL